MPGTPGPFSVPGEEKNDIPGTGSHLRVPSLPFHTKTGLKGSIIIVSLFHSHPENVMTFSEIKTRMKINVFSVRKTDSSSDLCNHENRYHNT